MEYGDYGASIATWRVSKQKHVGEMSTFNVLNVGPIQVGVRTYYVGIIPGRKDIFLGANGKVWRYPRRKLFDRPPEPPDTLNPRWRKSVALWASVHREAALERMDVMPEHALGNESRTRYVSLVRSLVFKRILDCAAFGVARTPRKMAKYVSPHWTEYDLIDVVVPTVRHAVLVSLLLALREDEAANLIELAAFCEYRCTVVTAHSARALYQGAAEQLARMCPEWWSAGYATNWEQYGSIEQRMRRQFMRIVRDAADIDGSAHAIAGVQVQAAARAAVEHAGVDRQVSERTLERNARIRAWHAGADERKQERMERMERMEREQEPEEQGPASLAVGLLNVGGSA